MTSPHESKLDPEEQLLAFGDDGTNPDRVARDDLEATLLRVQQSAATTIPDRFRSAIWEDLMRTHVTSPPIPSVNGSLAEAGSTSFAGTVGSARRRTPGWWQSGISLALVLAFLAGLVAIAYQAGPGNGPDGRDPDRLGQVLYDPSDLSSFPPYPETCVSNGDVPTDDELVGESLEHWPAPQYVPAKPVTEETGRAVQETFLNYSRCEQELFSTWTPSAATPVSPVQSPLIQSYFSERARFDHLYSQLPLDQQAALDAYRCLPRLEQIERDFPLPVNQHVDYAVRELAADGTPTYLALIFAPSDVYLMPDERYGAIAGSISVAELRAPTLIPQTEHPVFYAFVEVDGRFYIDEIITLFMPEAATSANGRNGTLSTDCE